MCSKKEVRKSCILVLGPMRSTFFKKKEKQGLLLDPNPVPHARTLVFGPSQEFLWHRRIVLRFSNIGFDQARSQQQFSLFFAPPTRPLKCWKESYMTGSGVSIGGQE